jgi:hypothetical protein
MFNIGIFSISFFTDTRSCCRSHLRLSDSWQCSLFVSTTIKCSPSVFRVALQDLLEHLHDTLPFFRVLWKRYRKYSDIKHLFLRFASVSLSLQSCSLQIARAYRQVIWNFFSWSSTETEEGNCHPYQSPEMRCMMLT